MIKVILSILLLASPVFAAGKGAGDNQLSKISSEEKDGKTYIHFHTSKAVDMSTVEAHFLRRSVEWDMAGIAIKKDKMFVDVRSNDVNNVYVSYGDEKSVHVRVNLDNGKFASNYHERLSFQQDKSGLTVIMDPSAKLLTNNIKELSRAYQVDAADEAQIAEHMNTASVLKVGSGAAATATVAIDSKDGAAANDASAKSAGDDDDTITLDDNKSEEQIPLKIHAKEAKAAAAPSIGRMVAGLGAVALVMLSIFLLGRKVNRKRLGAQFNHDSITVVAQKYLGPKRNLTLVRVSGEYLLLGVTDANISLIKTLAVVDDEIPALTPNDFGAAVKNMSENLSARAEGLDEMADEVEDSFTVSSLNDVKKMFKKRKYIDE